MHYVYKMQTNLNILKPKVEVYEPDEVKKVYPGWAASQW